MSATQQLKSYIGIREWHTFTLLLCGLLEFYRVDVCSGDVDYYDVHSMSGETAHGRWRWLVRENQSAFGAHNWMPELLQDRFGI